MQIITITTSGYGVVQGSYHKAAHEIKGGQEGEGGSEDKCADDDDDLASVA